ncbi:NAD(P)-binding protein [Piedraia hortae CBS 480.64]|uniref:NAD(P)-binding protein n=1 Tax=Piedraia hortae CBS 480.64 TaxID=1314780 RepID=A0A6A7BYK9_9PEZI|nr:NAD(P)-binding protein [Piedraia hortae CBS 480.64]
MMPLTVLRDADVDRILHSYTREDILELQRTLADALHWYSTSSDANDYCSDFQPERIALNRKDGSTTFFMPASCIDGQAVKVINLSGCVNPKPSSNASEKYVDGERLDAKGAISGSLTLMDSAGNTTGLVHATELTAFRTALASTMLLKKRSSVHTLTVFGAGLQAYWHIRLAMLLRPGEIHHLNVITRNFERATKCLIRLYDPQPNDPNFTNNVDERYNSKTKSTILTTVHSEFQRLRKNHIRSADVIFCCTPSTTPLFPAECLTNPEGQKKGRYVACIGSYKPDMIELDPDVLRFAVSQPQKHHRLHRRSREGGAVIVDTVTGALSQAGEIVQAKLLPEQVVELGELVMLSKEAKARRAAVGQSVDEGCNFQDDEALQDWVTRGNVLYKSVGLGLVDVVVGNEVIDRARQTDIGVTIDF